MKIKLIVGLGNPGEDYQNTYHNVGFLALDFLTSSGVNVSTDRSDGWQKEKNFWFLTQDRVIFVKPRTFMNLSGLAARQALAKFKVTPENTLVIHDDSDLNLGQSKLSFGRGGAGHRGVTSIIRHLKTKNFWRLRLGIRPENEKTRSKAEIFVLKKIKPSHLKIIYGLVGEVTTKLIEKEKP